MYCQKCGKVIDNDSGRCEDCRRLEKESVVVKTPSSAIAFAIACLVIGIVGCLIVWLPYLLSRALEDAVADVIQNGYSEGNMGVTSITFIFTILTLGIPLAAGVMSAAFGITATVSAARGKGDRGNRFVAVLVLSVIGFLLALLLLGVCGMIISKLVVLFR